MSEDSILNAAATIFSGMYASGKVKGTNSEKAKKYAFATALQFTVAAERKNLAALASIAEGEVPFPT